MGLTLSYCSLLFPEIGATLKLRFKHFRKVSISDYQLCHISPSSQNNSAPTGQSIMKFDI
jgi:hypothetical protein